MTQNVSTCTKNPASIRSINIPRLLDFLTPSIYKKYKHSTVVTLPYMKYGVLSSRNVSTLYMFQYPLFINLYTVIIFLIC